MTKVLVKRRKIAIVLLLIWGFNMAVPSISYALTSGPAQPETKGFQAASVSDMVDLQSGDMKYNIPLLDIDGYPLNLSYQSGTGIDDEASWVGLGWSLNPGAINRQVRGLPDDFSGDIVETDHYTKPKITVGGKLTAKVESRGIAKLGGSFSLGVFSDNYTGLGAELGVNAGISFSMPNDGLLTAGLGVGVLSNTQSGAELSVSPYVCMSIKESANNNYTTHAGLSGSFGYNTRSGLKSLTLGATFGANYKDAKIGGSDYNIGGSSITYNTEPISPSVQIPYHTEYDSFSFDVGPIVGTFFASLGGTGYRSVRSVKTINNLKPAYGFLYADSGKNNKDAVMDFFREKDNPIIPELPNLALPIHTPDTWSYTSQAGGGQFRLYRGGTGAFFDNQSLDDSHVSTTGGDLGAGAWAHLGITHFEQETHTTTGKWTNNNNYLANGDFQSADYSNPLSQHVYFRQVGEKGLEDQVVNGKLYNDKALEVSINGTNTAEAGFRTKGSLYAPSALAEQVMTKTTDRRANRTGISYLTAAEASVGGFDKKIKTYAFNNVSGYTVSATPSPTDSVARVGGSYKKHHISEMTVTDDNGKRMVYGIPVYNTTQDEYSFAIGASSRDSDNLVNVPNLSSPSSNTLGVDNYYHKEHKPGYATSYLLTAILSPDYVDKTGNGISDDDLGTPIKFNYSRINKFRWRTPYSKASANKCLNADLDDDKGSIIYGEKELYYVHTIETKTKIAYFITENRNDAFGVTNWQSGGRDNSQIQKCLREIRLYSKADMTRPIKVVKFQYTYELCRGVPNSLNPNDANLMNGGKLTLAKVWFEYGNSDKGKYHPYIFQYNKKNLNYPTLPEIRYKNMQTDRWGVYKNTAENTNGLDNEQYPYANQDTSYRNQNASLWHLKQITLPTGGVIDVSYESNDYAYVQDQKAMVMTGGIKLINDAGTPVIPLNQSMGLQISMGTVNTPPVGADQTKWFKDNFLDGSDYMYTKLCIKFNTNNSRNVPPVDDFVPTYCKVRSVSITPDGLANVLFEPINESGLRANPISISAWQRLKNEYPKYAYPGYDNRVNTSNNTIIAAVSAIINAAKIMGELSTNFYQKANDRGYASEVTLGKSFVRITKANGFKLGGGARVKQIRIFDSWNLTSTSNVTSTGYGQAYNYTTTGYNGKIISSGVATYEPSVGNDENPLKQPVIYKQNIKGAINNYFDLEKPFGESLYPAPSIGYSKVTVQDLDKDGHPSSKTGSVVSEFYTAKDFPVKVTVLPMIPISGKPSNHYSLTSTTSDESLCLSQGYSIELNDMHGKPKANRVFNQSGAEISSTVYYYSATDNGGTMSLNNSVPVINTSTLLVANKVLGRDIDFFTDFREQESTNKGSAINLGMDVFPIPPFIPAFPLPHKPTSDNSDHKLFRSACAVKVVQNYGIMSKVVKTENGSSVTTENLAYDELTGEAIVTRTQNEFKGNLYSVNIPAYWAYKGMGPAYKNLGVLLKSLATNANGEVSSSTYATTLQAGDEIIDLTNGNKYWIIENLAASGVGTTKKVIDRDGNIKASTTFTGLVKIVRSGYRNMLTANATTLVSLTTPFTTDKHLKLTTNGDLTPMKVINASATTFDENWAVNNESCNQSASGAVEDHSRDWTMRRSPRPDTISNYFAVVDTEAHSLTQSNLHYSGHISGSFFNSTGGRMSSSNIYPSDPTFRNTYSLSVNFTVDSTKTYYVGVGAAANSFGFIFDCFNDGITFPSYVNQWTILPVFLTAGKHTLTTSLGYNSTYENSMGIELYNNTLTQILNAGSGSGINIIFSTAQLRSVYPLQSSTYDSSNQMVYHYYNQDGSPLDACPTNAVLPTVRNPYVSGYLGNWRPYQTKVLQQSRNYSYTSNMTRPGIDVKNAGYINGFSSYWYYNTSSVWAPNANATKWITANTVTLYDKYGQQLENKDALGRYSAAKFDFNGELPSAVASNAQNREVYAGSLEDNRFTPGSSASSDDCNIRDFKQSGTNLPLKGFIVNTTAHSGNYSVQLPSSGITLSTIVHSMQQKTLPYLILDAKKQYLTQSTVGLYPNGFEPSPNKKYIFDTWVYDGLPNDKSINISLTINTQNVPLTCKAVVEGWKLVEGVMDLSTLGGTTLNISITPTGTGTKYIDDIRIHPFDAHMKTYAYDDKTMRLMAELDENGFATFYEYDDEGLLIRVKKETEKGIVTLKETRSSYRRKF